MHSFLLCLQRRISSSGLDNCGLTNGGACKSELKMLNSITNIPRKERADVDHSSRSSSVVSASSRKPKTPVNKENHVKDSSRQENGAQSACSSEKNANSSDETVSNGSAKFKSQNGKRNANSQPAKVKLNGDVDKNDEPEQPSSHSSSATSSTERPKKGDYLDC